MAMPEGYTKEQYHRLVEFMDVNYGVTPENIDEKLDELRQKLRRKINELNTRTGG